MVAAGPWAEALAADAELAAVAWRFMGPGAYEAYVADAAYADSARATYDNWALKVRAYERIERSLRDMAHWVAAEAALLLDAAPEGLTPRTLEALLRSVELASRGRGGLILAYLQYLRLVEAEPGRGRNRHYRPTAELREFMRLRMQRDLEAMAPLDPLAGEVLAAWDRPGFFDRFMAAGRAMVLCSMKFQPPPEASLKKIMERNSGMTILGQLLMSDDDGGPVFPQRGPVRLNILDLARRSGAPRHQVMHVVRIGRARGLLIDQPDGRILFSPGLIAQSEYLLGIYWRSLIWRGRAALDG